MNCTITYIKNKVVMIAMSLVTFCYFFSDCFCSSSLFISYFYFVLVAQWFCFVVCLSSLCVCVGMWVRIQVCLCTWLCVAVGICVYVSVSAHTWALTKAENSESLHSEPSSGPLPCCCPVALTVQKVSSRNLEPSWGTGAKSGDTRQGWRSTVIEYRSVGWPHGYFLLFSLPLTLQAMQGANGYDIKLVEWKNTKM